MFPNSSWNDDDNNNNQYQYRMPQQLYSQQLQQQKQINIQQLQRAQTFLDQIEKTKKMVNNYIEVYQVHKIKKLEQEQQNEEEEEYQKKGSQQEGGGKGRSKDEKKGSKRRKNDEDEKEQEDNKDNESSFKSQSKSNRKVNDKSLSHVKSASNSSNESEYNELEVSNMTAAQSVNMFLLACKGLHAKNDEKSLELGKIEIGKYEEYLMQQNFDHDTIQRLKPILGNMKAALKGVDTKGVPPPQFNNFNKEVVKDGMESLFQSTHNIQNKKKEVEDQKYKYQDKHDKMLENNHNQKYINKINKENTKGLDDGKLMLQDFDHNKLDMYKPNYNHSSNHDDDHNYPHKHNHGHNHSHSGSGCGSGCGSGSHQNDGKKQHNINNRPFDNEYDEDNDVNMSN